MGNVHDMSGAIRLLPVRGERFRSAGDRPPRRPYAPDPGAERWSSQPSSLT